MAQHPCKQQAKRSRTAGRQNPTTKSNLPPATTEENAAGGGNRACCETIVYFVVQTGSGSISSATGEP
jgi:hypothetical protein